MERLGQQTTLVFLGLSRLCSTESSASQEISEVPVQTRIVGHPK